MRLAVAEIERLFGDRLSYRERMAGGPDWLSGELVSTPAAMRKLAAYLEETPRPWRAPARTFLAAAVFGDELLLPPVVRVLEHRLPPPVAVYALEHVTFLGVGGRVAGWCSPPVDPGGRPWLNVIRLQADDESNERTVAHEIAHAWLGEESAGAGAMRAVEQWAVETAPSEQVEAARPAAREIVATNREHHDYEEPRVRKLLRAWGFDEPDEPKHARRWQ